MSCVFKEKEANVAGRFKQGEEQQKMSSQKSRRGGRAKSL